MLPPVKMVIIALLTYNLQAGGMPPDSKAAFKAEWEALEVFNNLTHTHTVNSLEPFPKVFGLTSYFKVTEHTWALKNSDQEMMALVEPTPEHLYHQK